LSFAPSSSSTLTQDNGFRGHIPPLKNYIGRQRARGGADKTFGGAVAIATAHNVVPVSLSSDIAPPSRPFCRPLLAPRQYQRRDLCHVRYPLEVVCVHVCPPLLLYPLHFFSCRDCDVCLAPVVGVSNCYVTVASRGRLSLFSILFLTCPDLAR
jgi:hypothetical protein